MLALTNIWAALGRIFTMPTFGQAIEQYILSRNPQTPADVERYAVEFQQRYGGGSWL